MKKLAIIICLFSIGCGQLKPPADGQNGSAGPQGVAGQDATPTYVVQLCPNQPHPSYPNHFPEMGFCLDHKLYGVFNGSVDYLTELPPGNYASIAPEGCNLTISTNCQVTQQ